MKIGMLFPGYGSQFVGMAKELYDNSRVMQEYFEEASHCLDLNFVKLCFASSDLELSKINNAYPAIFLLGTSIAAMLKSLNISIDYVAGQGIGEYSALCTAGGINFPDALYLLKKLCDFYTKTRQQLDVKSIAIDGLTSHKLKRLCKEHSSENCCVQIAIYERDKEHIVTGHKNAVDAVAQAASCKGADKVTQVCSDHAFHTPLLNELLEQLKIYLTKVDFKDLTIPMISGISGKEILDSKTAQDTLMNQIIKPIYWGTVLKQFVHVDLIIIPSPSKNLVDEVKLAYPDKLVIAIETLLDIDKINSILSQLSKLSQEKLNIKSDNNSDNNIDDSTNLSSLANI